MKKKKKYTYYDRKEQRKASHTKSYHAANGMKNDSVSGMSSMGVQDVNAENYSGRRVAESAKGGLKHEATDYDEMIYEAADKYNIPRPIFRELIYQESRFKHDTVSPKGAIGLGQIMPKTARSYKRDPSKLKDPEYNLDIAAQILSDNYKDKRVGKNWKNAIGYYNAGNSWFTEKGQQHALKESPKYFAALDQTIRQVAPIEGPVQQIAQAKADKTSVPGQMPLYPIQRNTLPTINKSMPRRAANEPRPANEGIDMDMGSLAQLGENPELGGNQEFVSKLFKL